MPETPASPTDRRALLAGLGGLAAGTFLSASRAEAGSLTPPGAPSPTSKPLAEIEPRVAVNDENTPGHSTASFIITEAGSYYLSGNVGVGSESVGVLIEASNVTLDLNGFSIIGKDSTTSAAGVAVASGCSDVAVVNGFIAECRIGVVAEEAVSRILVRNVHVRNTQFEAIFLPNNSLVEDCTVLNGGGVTVGSGSRVVRCVMEGGGYIGIATSGDCVVIDNQIIGKLENGITVSGTSHVEGNTVRGCGSGIWVFGGNSIIRNNTVLDNTTTGLRVDSAGSTVSGNTVRGNGTNYQFVAGNQLELLISQIPQTLSWPCSATLQGTLQGLPGNHGIIITSSNVTLDLGGHALIGPVGGVNLFGVMVDFGGFYESITVRNGSVRGWLNGVDVERGRNALVENVHSSHNSEAGIVGGQGAVIRNCTARENAQQGIRVLKGASVVECTAESNAVDFPSGAGFVFGEGATLQDCAANRNISGFVGSMCSLSNCTAYQNIDYGFSIFVGTMSGCMATSNKVGIRVSNFTVSNCQAISNGEVGIWGEESILVGNRVRSNGSSSLVGYAGGIFATHLSRVEGNHCHANRRGIYCSGGAGNLIIRNTCISNTTNWSVGIGNALAPVVVASQTPGLFEGDSYAGSLGSTDPNANFTIIII